jgi:hypothetical protein
VSVFFGVSLREQGVVRAALVDGSLNFWDQVLSFTLDPYYMAYLLFPVWLLTSSAAIHRHFDVLALVRLGSYRDWLVSSATHAVRRSAPLLLGWLLAAVVTSYGLPLSWTWSSASLAPPDHNVILGRVSHLGLPPAAVLGLQLGLVALTLLACHTVLATVHLVARRRSVTFLAAAALFFSVVWSFRNPLSFAALDFANFYMLHRAAEIYRPLVLVFGPLLVVLALCLTAAIYSDRRTTRGSLPWPVLVYAGLCVLGVLYAYVYELGGAAGSPLDVLWVAFYGVSAEGFSPNLYLFHSIVFLGFVYLFQISLSDELSSRIYYVTLRCGSALRWLIRFLLSATARIPLVLLAVLGFTVVIFLGGALLTSGGTTVAGTPEPGWLLYQFFVNGALQLVCYLLIVFVVTWVTGHPFAGLATLGALLVLGLPALNAARTFPAALNSLGYTTLGGGELLRITAVLGAYLCVLGVAAVLLLRNRRMFFNERIS